MCIVKRKNMKHLVLFPVLFISITLLAQERDTLPRLSITEIKPGGFDRFIEVYSDEDTSVTISLLVIRSVIDNTLYGQSFPPHTFTLLPLPNNPLQGSCQLMLPFRDTLRTITGIAYLLLDSNYSMGVCTYMLPMIPSPGLPNDCNSLGIEEVSPKNESLLNLYSIEGRKVEDKDLPRGIYIGDYTTKRRLIVQ